MRKFLKWAIPKAIGLRLNSIALFAPVIAARQAFYIFCKVRRGRVKPKQQSFLHPARDQQLVSNGKKIQTYFWKGEGPLVLLIHGWESNTHRWWKLIADLQKHGFTICAFDAPAHGDSEGKLMNIALYIQALEIVTQHYKPRFHVAHSVGALTTIYYYKQYTPAHIQKIVALGAASELSDIMEDYQQLLGLTERVMKALEHLIKDTYGFNFAEVSGATFAKAISIPGLVIHDKEDCIVPVKASRAIAAQWENSRYIETEGLGHSLYQDEIRQTIIQFLEEV